jgi:hypothetical protein
MLNHSTPYHTKSAPAHSLQKTAAYDCCDMNATLPRLLHSGEVGDWLGMPGRKVERLARRGVIPGVLLPSGEWVFDAAQLATWFEQLLERQAEDSADE